MTAGELIRFLQKYPAETRVLVEGHDVDYDDPRLPDYEQVAKLDYEPGVPGRYSLAGGDPPPEAFFALLIERDR